MMRRRVRPRVEQPAGPGGEEPATVDSSWHDEPLAPHGSPAPASPLTRQTAETTAGLADAAEGPAGASAAADGSLAPGLGMQGSARGGDGSDGGGGGGDCGDTSAATARDSSGAAGSRDTHEPPGPGTMSSTAAIEDGRRRGKGAKRGARGAAAQDRQDATHSKRHRARSD